MSVLVRPVLVRPQVLGIFGGGQLARMTCVAAQALGYSVRVLDPDPHCPAAVVCNELVTASYDDVIAAQRLALGCAAVTVDLEGIGIDAMRAAAQHAPVYPSADALFIVQDRARQRRWLADNQFPIPALEPVSGRAELLEAVVRLHGDRANPLPVYVKTVQGGYDGKGQVRVVDKNTLEEACVLAEHRDCVVEQHVSFVAELSLQVARSPSGECVAFPPAYNHHENQILAWTMLPAPVPANVSEAATALVKRIAEKLDLVGLLTVELFLLPDGQLWVNELAPRPHNSYHTTITHARTSQFEQLVRAVLDLPLGVTGVYDFTVVANLLGDLWPDDGRLDLSKVLAIDGVDVTIYGKRIARPARKMGHLSATSDKARGAYDAAAKAMKLLGSPIPAPALDLASKTTY